MPSRQNTDGAACGRGVVTFWYLVYFVRAADGAVEKTKGSTIVFGRAQLHEQTNFILLNVTSIYKYLTFLFTTLL